MGYKIVEKIPNVSLSFVTPLVPQAILDKFCYTVSISFLTYKNTTVATSRCDIKIIFSSVEGYLILSCSLLVWLLMVLTLLKFNTDWSHNPCVQS